MLTVDGLPTEDNRRGAWYVDVGLGDALHEPLPLLEGAYRQAPWQLGLDRRPGDTGAWHLTHDPGGGFTGMGWRSAPTAMGAFAAQHRWLSTAPDSGFVKVMTVQRRDAAGVDVLRGLVLLRIGDGASEETISSRAELLEVFAELGLRIDDLDEAALVGLWRRLEEAHAAWEAAGRNRV